MLISVVIPTITGREAWLERCLQAYELYSPPDTEYIVIKDEPSCGVAWQKGWEQSHGDFVHFTADDLEPYTQWWREAIHVLQKDIVPAAMVYAENGNLAVCDSPLGDMGHHPNVLVPFLTRAMLEQGEWLLPVHYGSDDWVSYMATLRGYAIQRLTTYRLTHHVAPEGRDYMRRPEDVKKLAEAMQAKGYLPPVYMQLYVNLQGSKTGLDAVKINQLDRNVREQLREQQRVAAQ